MKNTGMIRPLDKLGRVVIPKEIMNVLDIKDRDELEFYFDSEYVGNDNEKKWYIGIKKRIVGCVFCESEDRDSRNVIDIKGKKVCLQCCGELSDIYIWMKVDRMMRENRER